MNFLLIMPRLLLKIESENITRFLQQFFRFWSGAFPGSPTPPAAPEIIVN